MAQFLITGPDGNKYKVTGDSAEGALQALKKHIGGNTAQPPQADAFEAQASKLDPMDLSIARSKNDQFGAYLRGQAQKTVDGETPEVRDARLFGAPLSGPSKLQSAAAGAADMVGFGLADEIGAGIQSAVSGQPYSQSLSDMGEAQGILKVDNPKSYVAGQIAGAVGNGAMLAKGGLTAARYIPEGAMSGIKGLFARSAVGAADGAAQGAVYGLGSGEGGIMDRAASALENGAIGAVGGAVAPALVSALTKGLRAGGAMFGVGGEGAARDKIVALLERSGMTPEQIMGQMQRAEQAGLGDVYTVADAMGKSGQNPLAAVTRSATKAGDAAQTFLDARHADMPSRVASMLDDAGAGKGSTAQQVKASLKSTRSMLADEQYGAARDAAKAVDVSGAIAKADEFLTPGVNSIVSPISGIADDSVEAAMRKARSFLTDGKSTLSDFDSVHRAKIEVQNMVDSAKPGSDKARRLKQIVTSLDDSLSQASEPYAKARDTYSAYSRTGEAVDTGAQAASRSSRAGDVIQSYSALPEAEKQGMRAGYFDKLAGTAENSPVAAPGIVRKLATPEIGTGRVAQSIASDGNALISKAQLENEMLNTYSKTKGSPTALNLNEDQALGTAASVAKDGFIKTIVNAIGSRASGMTDKSIERIAQTLMARGPVATESITKMLSDRSASKGTQEAIIRSLLLSSGAVGSAAISEKRR